jgi:demethylphylloquinol methyltransferase
MWCPRGGGCVVPIDVSAVYSFGYGHKSTRPLVSSGGIETQVRCAGPRPFIAQSRLTRHDHQVLAQRTATSATGFDKPTERQMLFDNISDDYDMLNDQLSLGQHRVWKRMAVAWSGAAAGGDALDVCCGSGDLTMLLANVVGPSGTVVGLDFAANMLERAKAREGQVSLQRCRIHWVQGDAMALPFQDRSFDAVTMGYGLRNVSDSHVALREVWRVLRPGGRAAFLDFNHATNPLVDIVQGFLLDNVVVPVAKGRGVSAEYEYLKPSIACFPTGVEQERAAREAGFASAQHYELGFGFMGCLVTSRAPGT